jgi:ribosomal protein S12 methylthiotransferase accessory factor
MPDGLEILRRLASQQVGILPYFSFSPFRNLFSGAARLVSAQTGHLDELYPDAPFLRARRGSPITATGGGYAADQESAFVRAGFEALERYATAVFPNEAGIVGSPQELSSRAMQLENLSEVHVVGPASEEQQVLRLAPDAAIRWVPGYDLVSRRKVLVPFAMAHIFCSRLPSEEVFVSSTAGVAAHTSLAKAFSAALYELVERDAVEATWLLRLPLPEISLAAAAPAGMATYMEADSVRFVRQRYFDATCLNGIPTVFALRETRPPLGDDVITTCASRPDIRAALIHARVEAAAVQEMRLAESGGEPYVRFRNPTDFCQDELPLRPDLSFLGSLGLSVPWGEKLGCDVADAPANSPQNLVDHLAARHPQIIAVNLTTDELEEAGVAVVRAIVPTLLPCSAGTNRRFLSHPRLREVSVQFGIREPDPQRWNLEEHPFC